MGGDDDASVVTMSAHEAAVNELNLNLSRIFEEEKVRQQQEEKRRAILDEIDCLTYILENKESHEVVYHLYLEGDIVQAHRIVAAGGLTRPQEKLKNKKVHVSLRASLLMKLLDLKAASRRC